MGMFQVGRLEGWQKAKLKPSPQYIVPLNDKWQDERFYIYVEAGKSPVAHY